MNDYSPMPIKGHVYTNSNLCIEVEAVSEYAVTCFEIKNKKKSRSPKIILTTEWNDEKFQEKTETKEESEESSEKGKSETNGTNSGKKWKSTNHFTNGTYTFDFDEKTKKIRVVDKNDIVIAEFISGENGTPGKSAYDDWKVQQKAGEDSIYHFLNFMIGKKGDDGKSAYDIWAERQEPDKRGYNLFINAITGKDGVNGANAFELWLETQPEKRGTIEGYYKSLKGTDGKDGQDGKSAYDIWVERQEPDKRGYNLFISAITGKDGVNGANAFELWLETQPEKKGTIEGYYKYLKGADGRDGQDGKSAYEIWAEQQDLDKRGYNLFINAISGKDGKDGESAYDVWVSLHKKEETFKTEEDFFDDIAARVETQDGATFIPEFTPDGKLYFKNSKTGEATEPRPVKGVDGKKFYPRFDGCQIYFVDENDIPQTPKYDTRGKDGRTFKPNWNGDLLYFEAEDGEKSETRDLHGKDAFELWKEKHHKPDATFEEYEEFFRGVNIKSQYNYEDIKDSKVPILKISQNLITDSDLTDRLGAEEYYRYRQEQIEVIRKKGREMRGDWFQELFWWCAGVDTSILRTCSADHSKYVGVGTVIFFTALMAFFSCFIAMQLVFGEFKYDKSFPIGAIVTIPLLLTSIVVFFHYGYNRCIITQNKDQNDNEKQKQGIEYKTRTRLNLGSIGIAVFLFGVAIALLWWRESIGFYINMTTGIAIIIAIFWATMIFFLDRFITNTMYSDGKPTIGWLEFCSALPRILISVFLGIIISAPLELKIFNQEINEYIRKDKFSKIDQEVRNSYEYKDILKQKEDLRQRKNEANTQWLEIKRDDYKKYISLKTTASTGSNIAKKLDGSKYDKPSYVDVLTTKEIIDDNAYFSAKDSAKLVFEKLNNEHTSFNKTIDEVYKNVEKELKNTYNNVDSVGLLENLYALHAIAMKKEAPDGFEKIENSYWYALGFGAIIFLLSISLSCRWYNISNMRLSSEDGKKGKTRNKYMLWTILVPTSFVIGIICACLFDAFYATLYYLTTPIGLIMLLFILIDVSPVLYKMMLADGKYDKILHQDKLMEQDLIRLQVAKTLYKVNESELSSLSPFIFGKTFAKVSKLLEVKKDNADKTKKAFDLYEPTGSFSDEIKQANNLLFKEVLNMKYRIAWGAYSAWYRNMYDVMLGKKDDEEGQEIDPYNTKDQNIDDVEVNLNERK